MPPVPGACSSSHPAPSLPALLTLQILKYHVVPGPALSSSQLKTDQKLPTLLAADLEAAATVDPMASWIGFGSSSEDKPEDGVLTVSVQQVGGSGSSASCWLLFPCLQPSHIAASHSLSVTPLLSCRCMT